MLQGRTSRRQLLAGLASGGVALALGVRPRTAIASTQGPRKTLAAEIKHGGREFAQGLLLGARLQSGVLAGPGAFESVVVVSPLPFTHVGVHWLASDINVGFDVRTSTDGTTWTPWKKVHAESFPDETHDGETYGALVGALRHSYLQYRANLGTGATLSRVTATFLNTVDGPALQTSSLAICTSPSAKPVDYTREQWGADESIRSGTPAYLPAKRLILHHTVSSSDFAGNLTGAIGDVQAIYYYHAVTQGWGDIAYHYLIDGDGNVFEGRRGRAASSSDDAGCGREVASEGVRGTHTAYHNDETTSVAALGNYEPGYLETLQPRDALIAAIIQVAAFECSRQQFDPLLSGYHLRTDDFWSAGLPDITYHGQCSGNNTACCGQNLITKVDPIRLAVNSAINRSGPAVQLTSGPDGVTVTNGRASFAWMGSGWSGSASYEVCLVGFSVVKRTYDIKPLAGLSNGLRVWTAVGEATSRTLEGLAAGHYTFHVRPVGGRYAVSRTFLAKGKR